MIIIHYRFKDPEAKLAYLKEKRIEFLIF